MADDDLSALFETFSGSSAPRLYTDEDRDTQWSDYGRALGVGTINIGKGAAALTDWATDGKAGRETYQYLDELAKDQMSKTSPAFQRAASAEFLPDSVDDVSVWDNPGRSIAAKATLAAPSVVASIIPGFLAGRIASGIGLGLEASVGVGAATAKGAGSAMNAGDVTSQIYDEVAKQPHDVLMRSPKYREYVAGGMSEKDAKQMLMRDVVNVAPYVAAGITYLTGGVEGQVAGRLVGQETQGIIKGAVKGFLGEAVQESLESGSGELLSQDAQKNQYLINDYDWNKVLSQTIEGGVVGGALGGATGAVTSIGGNRRDERFTVDTVRRKMENKGLTFPEDRAEEIQQRIAGFATLPTQGEKQRAVTALLNELYAPTTGGVQVVAGPVGATEAAALQTETQTAPPAVDPAQQVLAGKIQQAQELAGGRDSATVPETTDQFKGQFDELAAGSRKAVFVPKGATAAAPQIEGMQSVELKAKSYPADTQGTYYFVGTSPQEIRALAKANKINTLFGMGETTKEEALATGEKPVAIQKTNAQGTATVQQAVAPSQVQQNAAQIMANAQPGDTLGVTTPEAVLQARAAGAPAAPVTPIAPVAPVAPAPKVGPKTGRILEAVTNKEVQAETNKKLAENIKKAKKLEGKQQKQAERIASGPANDEMVGQYTGKDSKRAETRAERDSVAKQVFNEFQPTEAEADWNSKDKEARQKAREALVKRANAALRRAMELAKEKGVELPSKQSPQMSNENVWLLEAARFLRAVGSKGMGRVGSFQEFTMKELSYRGGDQGKAARADRREGGDLAKRQDQGSVEDKAAGVDTTNDENEFYRNPEQALVAKQEEDAGPEVEEFTGKRTAPPPKKVVDEARVKREMRRVQVRAMVKRIAEKRAAEKAQPAAKVAPNQDLTATFDEVGAEKERLKALFKDLPDAELQKLAEAKVEKNRKAAAEYRARKQEKAPQTAEEWLASQGKDWGDSASSMRVDASESWADKHNDPANKRNVVYFDDEVALVAAPAVNGKTLYVPAHRDKGIARVDVGSFSNTNKVFTDEQFERLKQAKEAILAQESAARPEGAVMGMNGQWVVPINTLALESALKRINFEKFGPLFPVIRDRVLNEVRGVKIHVVSAEDLFSLTGKSSALGLYEFVGTGKEEQIFVRGDLEHNEAVETVIHEAVHALVLRVMRQNPQMRTDMNRIANAVRDHWTKKLGTDFFKQFPFARYAYTSVDEFVSEAWGNSQLQELLMRTPLSEELANQLGVKQWRQRTVWQALMEVFTEFLHFPRSVVSAMEAIAKVTDEAADQRMSLAPNAGAVSAPRLDTTDVTNMAKDRSSAIAAWAKRNWPKFLTGDQMRQQYKNTVIGPALEQIWNASAALGPKIKKFEEAGKQLAQRAIDLQQKFPQQMAEFAEIAERARMMNISIEDSNAHLGQDDSADWQAKAELAALQGRFNASTFPEELRQLYRDMTKFYNDSHEAIVRASVESILTDLVGKGKVSAQDIAGLAKRVMDQAMTDTDKTLLGPTVFKALENATEFHKVEGDYFPLMRFGDHVVRVQDKIKDTMGGILEGDDTVLFKDKSKTKARKAAKRFAENSDLRVVGRAKKVFFDARTGQEVTEDQAKSLNDVEIGFRVKVQTNGVYFFESGTKAAEFVRTNPEGHDTVHQPEMRMGSGYQAQILSGSQLSSINSAINGRDDINAGQKELLKSILVQSATRMMGGNRVQSRRLKAQKVVGASRDIGRVLLQYNEAMARHMGNAEALPTIRNGFRDMESALQNYEGNDRPQLVAVQEEVRARLNDGVYEPNAPGTIMKDALTVSFLARLFSPAHSIINGLQVMMVALPRLGARFGNLQASAAVRDAYSAIGLGDTVLSGLMNTVRATKQFKNVGLLGTDDIIGNIRKRISGDKDLLSAFDRAIELGAIDGDAGMEIGSAHGEGRGAWGKSLSAVDRIARQMPSMVEAVNRTATLIASYKLARGDGQSHEAAMQYAIDEVKNSQGDYSAGNAPRFFNNPYLRPAMQFRKYAQMMTYLMADATMRSFKGATPEERRIARKELRNFFAVQIAMAGALSVPGLELVKVAFLVAAALGFGGGWDEQEEELKKLADRTFGKEIGQMITSGVFTRLGGYGVDLSSRVSLADLWLFGEPKKDDRESMEAYLFRLLAGSSGTFITQTIDGIKDVGNGEIEKGLGKALPVKFIADFAKGIKQYNDPRNNGEVGLGTVAVNTIGLRTAAQAEKSREIADRMRQKDKLEKERKELSRAFYEAKNKGDKVKAAAKNKEFNNKLDKSQWRLRLPTNANAGAQ